MILKLKVNEKDKNKDEGVKIVLNMIVKNESQIILRLLESVYKLIDAYCICDTGSTDNTIEIINNFFKKKDVKGCVIKHKFKNFGHNRNWSLDKCRLIYENFDFILLLDADMVVSYSKTFLKNKEDLKNYDYYYILQGNKNFKYRNIRLIKINDKIKYKGDTHEYLNIPVNLKSKTLDVNDMFIEDIGDGANKGDKFDRDIRILQESILVDPDNTRSYFYLANSYFDIGKYDEAIKNYKIRIEKGGWYEEIFYSMYRIGLCYMGKKKYEKAILKFLNAYQLNPGRAEPLYELIKHFRIKKHYSLANLFFKQAICIEHPQNDALFINSDIYNYKLLYEFYIFYFYLNINDKTLYDETEIHDVFFKLLNKNYYVRNLLENYKFYSKKIDYNIKCEQLNIKRYDLTGIKDNFNSGNIALIEHNNKLKFFVRYSNYYFNDNWDYVYRGKEKTKNYLITYKDEKYEEIETDNRINENDRKIKDYDILQGLQDIRVLKFNNKIYYTGNIIFNYQDICGNYLRGSKLEYGVVDMENYKLDGTLINSPYDNICEKNWTLFNNKKKIFCIYKWHPLSIGLIKKNKFLIKLKTKTPKFFKHVCGSTHGIFMDNKILFICHIVFHGKPRYYYHIFIRIDSTNFQYIDHSYIFTFENQPIEYCCGMILKDELLYITYSVKDNITKLLTINPNDINFI